LGGSVSGRRHHHRLVADQKGGGLGGKKEGQRLVDGNLIIKGGEGHNMVSILYVPKKGGLKSVETRKKPVWVGMPSTCDNRCLPIEGEAANGEKRKKGNKFPQGEQPG